MSGAKVDVVGWFCDRDGETALTSGFVSENRAYVEAHKECNWRPLHHPDAVVELIEAIPDLLSLYRLKWGNLDQDANMVYERAASALSNIGPQS